MDVAARFPLLRLPNDERIKVLRQMAPINLAKLSFLSKKAKEMVKSRKLEAHSVLVSIDNEICIGPVYKYEIPRNRFYFSMYQEDFASKQIKKPEHIEFLEYTDPANDGAHIERKHIWKNEKFEVKDWLQHFHTIFHCKETEVLFSRNAFLYDFDSVYEHFKNPDALDLNSAGKSWNYWYRRKI